MAEKYSKWADKAGVNPFFPSKVALPSSGLGKWLIYTSAFVVAVPRVLFSAAIALLLMLFLSLISGRSMVSVLLLLGTAAYRGGGVQGIFGSSAAMLVGGLAVFLVTAIFRGHIKQLGIKIFLLVVGVNFNFQPGNLRRLGIVANQGDDKSKGEKIQPGDLIICNLTNPLEIVALEGFLQHPIFVFPIQVNDTDVSCLHLNITGAVFRVLTSIMPISGRRGKSLQDICVEARNDNRCVVFFAEGMRTNGDGVLRITSPLFASLLKSGEGDVVNIHLVGFQYPSPEKEFSPANPVGPFLKRLFWIASYSPMTPFSVKAEFVLASHLRPIPDVGSTTKQLDDFVAEIRDILANLMKKNKVDMGFDDYNSFCSYYKHLSVGDVKAAATIANSRKKY